MADIQKSAELVALYAELRSALEKQDSERALELIKRIIDAEVAPAWKAVDEAHAAVAEAHRLLAEERKRRIFPAQRAKLGRFRRP